MKKFLALLLSSISQFLGANPQSFENSPPSYEQLQETIQLALYKQAAVHVICKKKSFTGDIIRYDQAFQRLVLKHFTKNMNSIIYLADIQKISLVPDTIKNSQNEH